MKGTLTARGHHSSPCQLEFLQVSEKQSCFFFSLHKRLQWVETPEPTIIKNELVANVIKEGDLDEPQRHYRMQEI